MDASTRLFLWSVASAAFFGALASLFGALTSYFKARDGQAGGTALGHAVADAFNRVGDTPLRSAPRALLVGGVDGLAFGAAIGLCLGLVCAWDGQREWARLRPLFASGLALVLGALAFGLAARVLSGAGSGGLLGLFIGGTVGALAGFWLGEADGLMIGVLAGAMVGTAACISRRGDSG